MSLYDDDDTVTDKKAASGWASGIKLMQNKLAFKKATVTAPKRENWRKKIAEQPQSVIDTKNIKEEEENSNYFGIPVQDSPLVPNKKDFPKELPDSEWKFENEYDPFWPNDYEKFVQEMKERKREADDIRKREKEDRNRPRRDRERDRESTGFSRVREEEDYKEDRNRRSNNYNNKRSGAAIAPPPSLHQVTSTASEKLPELPQSLQGAGGTFAAKIMAKYGFKEGQGLGKSKQGIVTALQVEKTSKRGGRIVNEEYSKIEEDSPPGSPPPPPSFYDMPPPPPVIPKIPMETKPEPNISNILKTPSKVIMLLNMVGPGEVDNDLEPEVREECSSKYGPVSNVIIFEIPNVTPEEAVRIFVEFQRIEVATKAIIDLNGRFFGGRQVRAGFYDMDNFKAYKLNEPVSF